MTSNNKEAKISTSCNAGIAEKKNAGIENSEVTENLSKIKNKIVVLSGKGGVGKSTVAVNLAVALSRKGLKTGLLDIDIHGPSIPKMLNIEDSQLHTDGNKKLLPIVYNENLKAMSIGLMLPNSDDAIIWRGPVKHGVIKQFLGDVAWGELDYLIIDSPPGTGDEPLSICQLIEDARGAIIVTTPQEVAIIDVKKSITFCKICDMPILGIIENMSGFTCPDCGKTIDIFKTGGGKSMAEELGIPFLGSIPIEVEIAERGDSGRPLMEKKSDAVSIQSFNKIVDTITSKEVITK